MVFGQGNFLTICKISHYLKEATDVKLHSHHIYVMATGIKSQIRSCQHFDKMSENKTKQTEKYPLIFNILRVELVSKPLKQINMLSDYSVFLLWGWLLQELPRTHKVLWGWYNLPIPMWKGINKLWGIVPILLQHSLFHVDEIPELMLTEMTLTKFISFTWQKGTEKMLLGKPPGFCHTWPYPPLEL